MYFSATAITVDVRHEVEVEILDTARLRSRACPVGCSGWRPRPPAHRRGCCAGGSVRHRDHRLANVEVVERRLLGVQRHVAPSSATGHVHLPGLRALAASWITVGGGVMSPFTCAEPLRIFREAEAVSANPSVTWIESRYAGRKSPSPRRPSSGCAPSGSRGRACSRPAHQRSRSRPCTGRWRRRGSLRRRVLGVELLRVLLRNRSADRKRQRLDHGIRARPVELDHQRAIVGRRDPLDIGCAAGRVVRGLLVGLPKPTTSVR